MNWSDFQRKHIQPIDVGKFNVDGDKNFDLERHNKLIEDTMKHNERVSRDKHREYDKGIEERAFAAGKFIENIKSGGEGNVQKYFGKSYINYLKGQEIANKYKMAWTNEAKKAEGKKAFIRTVKSGGDV